jgi:hypothetical protein
MRRTPLAVKAAVVLALTALVSWPQFRPLSSGVWRYVPATVLQARTDDAARFADSNATASWTLTSPDVTPADDAANALTGMARTSLNAAIPHAHVALRNIRTGELRGDTIADANGRFRFSEVAQDVNVVEVLGSGGGVAGISGLIRMDARQPQHADIRVPAAASAVTASFAEMLTPTAPQATRVASAAGVTRTTPAALSQISPR